MRVRVCVCVSVYVCANVYVCVPCESVSAFHCFFIFCTISSCNVYILFLSTKKKNNYKLVRAFCLAIQTYFYAFAQAHTNVCGEREGKICLTRPSR